MSDGILELSSDGWIVPFLLLGLRERSSYEHELARRISTFGFEAPRPREPYLALRQMEEEGLAVSERDGSNGETSRRMYSITESGEAYLESWADSLMRYQEEVDLFFKAYDGAAWKVPVGALGRERR